MNEIPAKRSWTVKLERSGGGQILRIPDEIALDGDEAILRRIGDRVAVEAAAGKTGENLIEYLRRIPPITEDLPEIDDPPPEDVEI